MLSKYVLQNLREIKLSESSENQNQDLTNNKDDAFNLKEEKVTPDNAKSSVPPKILIYTLPQDKQFTIRTSALPINKEITIKVKYRVILNFKTNNWNHNIVMCFYSCRRSDQVIVKQINCFDNVCK